MNEIDEEELQDGDFHAASPDSSPLDVHDAQRFMQALNIGQSPKVYTLHTFTHMLL